MSLGKLTVHVTSSLNVGMGFLSTNKVNQPKAMKLIVNYRLNFGFSFFFSVDERRKSEVFPFGMEKGRLPLEAH